jgi:RHH-type transcriptional regulator, proline utilization regulon repressor / proline dehydrogenase / delta 1-pyrroline-5-carboxylate dehydrogenase
MARLSPVRPAEAAILPALIERARLTPTEAAAAMTLGRELVAGCRREDTGLAAKFLQQFSLATQEGVAILALAEAYLRVPDPATAAALIGDKLADRHWAAHRGKAGSALIDSAGIALALTGSLLDQDTDRSALFGLVERAGEPFVRKAVAAAMALVGNQFVLGRTIEEAQKRAKPFLRAGFRYSFDMLGEGARTAEDAARNLAAYADAIAAIGAGQKGRETLIARDNISVKLSAIHPRFEVLQERRCIPELIERMLPLCEQSATLGIGLTVDAEESERLEMSLDVLEALAAAPALVGWDGLGLAVQAYQKRAASVISWADATGAAHKRRMFVRLVKGAYWDSEIKHAQERGLADFPVFARKPATDLSYLACARAMLAANNLYPAFATHNARTVASIAAMAGPRRDFEFQRLHGMGTGLYDAMVAEQGYACRIYAPVGGHKELLAYLVRRLLENGANSSFVNLLADRGVSDAELLADPEHLLGDIHAAPSAIILPGALFGARRNSQGHDLNDRDELARLAHDVASFRPVKARAPVEIDTALVAAKRAASAWRATPVATRAACLDRMADALEADYATYYALLMGEAGKTLADAQGEVREAVDFCRYYAAQARRLMAEPVDLPGPTGEENRMRLVGRGVFLCIAPWNFPLAIFLGQVAAALVTGNAVIAKPAPQTPMIAHHAVDALIAAGVPQNVLHIITGGAETGAALVADARIDGVAFTGSTATARAIAKGLLEDPTRPLVPLIAETGGINAMIVDSTALPEQVADDVITSAFRSAGQRCSALRLLCVQEDVAEAMIAMIKGAMAELVIGDPRDFATDVGPVIDAAAKARLEGWIALHEDRLIARCPLPPACDHGHFVAPTMIRLAQVADLDREVFGPVLHVVTWKAGKLEALLEAIDASGYGLTMGVHSRISKVHEAIEARANVGNLYVNRSMIGAIVGSQPFGGEGLSGTGPKAGGPHYLPRFCLERTVSIDTSSAGGNAALLAGI